MTDTQRARPARPPTRLARLTGVERHDIALVLGSGWLPAVDALGEATAEIATTDLPGFGAAGGRRPQREDPQHPGRRQEPAGVPEPHPLLRGQGRRARSSTRSVRRPRPAAAAIVLTNGCGGLKETWSPGTPVLISDHINLTAHLPDRGRELRRPHRPLLQPAARAVPRGRPEPRRGRSTSSSPAPTTRPPPRSAMVRAIGGDAGRHEHDARGDRRPRGGPGGARHQPGHQPGRRHLRRAAQPRGGARGRTAAPPPGWAACSPRSSGRMLMRVLVTGAAGSIGRVVTVGLDRPRPRGRRRSTWCPRPRATTGRGTPSTAPTRTPSPRSSRPSRPDAVVHLAGIPDEADAARPSSPPTSSPPRRCWTRWSPTTSRGSSTPSSNHAVGRTPAPTRRRPAHDRRPAATRHVLRRRQGRGRGAAARCTPTGTASTRSPAGSGRSCEQPRGPPQPGDLAVPRRLRPDGRGRAHRARARVRRALRHQRQHPRLVGPRARPGARLRPAGRRRGLGRPAPRPAEDDVRRTASSAARSSAEEFYRPAL